MKALVYEKFGEPAEVLHLQEIPIPEPAPDQVLVRMHSMSLNPSNLALVRGVYKVKQKLPNVPGMEGVGEIVKVGSQVKSLKPGMRGMVVPDQISELLVGTWQEYICVPETALQLLPDQVDLAKMTDLPITVMSAWIITVNELNLGPGQTLLLTAAGSAVGRYILQLSKVRGFSVIAVVRRPEQVEQIKALGAKEVICSSTEDVGAKALSYTKLKGVDAALDCVGGDTTSHCLKALGDNGKLVIFGLLENKIQATFDTRKILFSNLTIKGFWLSGWLQACDYNQRTIVANKCIELLDKGVLSSHVEKAYKLEEFKEAVKHSERPGNTGRIIFRF